MNKIRLKKCLNDYCTEIFDNADKLAQAKRNAAEALGNSANNVDKNFPEIMKLHQDEIYNFMKNLTFARKKAIEALNKLGLYL